jgi:PTS system mannose-specific IID component
LDLVRCFLRSFFLQAVWNMERYLNYGFAFVLSPALRKLYPTKEERAQALTRHLEYFNTHPYMASFVLGAVLKMEEEKQALPRTRQKQKEDEINALKVGMMGPIAAMGDNLFWATVRPYCGLLAVTLVLSQAFPYDTRAWIIPALFLAVFNVAHLGVRTLGFLQGYRQSDQVVLALRKYGFQAAIRGLKLASILLVGVLIVFVNLGDLDQQVGLFILKLSFFSALVGLFTFALPSQLYYAVALVGLILAYWPEMSSPPAIHGEGPK